MNNRILEWVSKFAECRIILLLVLLTMLISTTTSQSQSFNLRLNNNKFNHGKNLIAPPTSHVDVKTATKAARLIRRGYFGASIGQGAGKSMTPLYGENSFIVITPTDFESLETGTIVAYRNDKGQTVIHQLIRKRGKKWIAQGLNNKVMDDEWVTSEKFIGVVYAVFHSNS